MQEEEPLGKENRQTWRHGGIHGWPFGSVNPCCSLYAHEFVPPPGTGQLITQRTAAVATAKLSSAAGNGKLY